jgi:hypothetical protein
LDKLSQLLFSAIEALRGRVAVYVELFLEKVEQLLFRVDVIAQSVAGLFSPLAAI